MQGQQSVEPSSRLGSGVSEAGGDASHVLARNTSIDGLRGFAVAAVIGVHVLERFFPGGGLGVDVFFVISGYVITAGLAREFERNGRLQLGRFYSRRIHRLWPALWVMVAFALIVGPLVGQPSGLGAALALTSTMNWARAFGWVPLNDALGHSWSLAVEEQFYLLWPPALIFLLHRRRLALPLLVGAIAAATLWRAWLLSAGTEAAGNYVYNALECRIDGLLLGCLIALTGWAGTPALRKAWILPMAGLAALVLLGVDFVPGVIRYNLIALLSGWLICAAIEAPPSLRLLTDNAAVQWAGLRSYSLYLWHMPIDHYLQPVAIPFALKLGLILGCSALASELSYRFVETRFRRPARAPVSGFASTTPDWQPVTEEPAYAPLAMERTRSQ